MNALGEEQHYPQTVYPQVHWPVALRHYKYKTIEEYFNTKVKRGASTHLIHRYSLEEFFKANSFTEDKMNYLLNLTKNMPDYRKELFELIKKHNINYNEY